MIGVTFYKGRYVAQIADCGRSKVIGRFTSELDAHNAWRSEKARMATLHAEKEKNERVQIALYLMAEKLMNFSIPFSW
jgi:hypothetical protein